MRFREVKSLAGGHTATESQSWDWNPIHVTRLYNYSYLQTKFSDLEAAFFHPWNNPESLAWSTDKWAAWTPAMRFTEEPQWAVSVRLTPTWTSSSSLLSSRRCTWQCLPSVICGDKTAREASALGWQANPSTQWDMLGLKNGFRWVNLQVQL